MVSLECNRAHKPLLRRAGRARAGDAAVIPAGFRGEFEVCEPVRKFYVVVSRNGGKAR